MVTTTTDQNQSRMSLAVKNNGSRNTEIRHRITEAYFIILAERMSANNAHLLSQFIILNRKQRNIATNTILAYIDGIAYLESFHKHKDLDKMDRNDITSFLDSYRKPETVDPLHKWINTYNMRLNTIYRFFRWLYDLLYLVTMS